MDDSLSLALAAVLLLFIVFYVLYLKEPCATSQLGFGNNSVTDKYSFIDSSSPSFMWSGLDDSDRTVEMDMLKGRVINDQPPPVSQTVTMRIIDQEYGKHY